METEAISGNENLSDPSQSSYRWVILILLALLYASFGLVTRSVAPLVTPILKDLQISYSEMGLILGSWQLTFIAGRSWPDCSSTAGESQIPPCRCADRCLSAGLRSLPKDFTGMLLAVTLFGVGLQ